MQSKFYLSYSFYQFNCTFIFSGDSEIVPHIESLQDIIQALPIDKGRIITLIAEFVAHKHNLRPKASFEATRNLVQSLTAS